jgi:hypothetical protein
VTPSARTVSVAIAGALTAALVIAFATRGADGGAGGSYAAEFREAIPKVEAAVGLPFKQPPTFEVRSREEIRRYVEQQLEDSLAREQISGQEAALAALGLIPDTMSLRALLLDILEEQIGGYYDPRTKVLYILEGSAQEVVAITVTHELIHALQDQYVSLDSVMRTPGNDDRQAAAQAVIEGQATFEQMRIMFGAEMPAIPGGWDRVREEIRNQRSRWPVFASAPLVVQEMLVFPYLTGAEFVRSVRAGNPQASPITDLPASTELIMHPAKYLGTRDTPAAVTLPPLGAVTVIYENTLGEFATRLFLYEHLRDLQGAIAGADGWDGDRYAVVRTPRGEGIIWVSIWDSLTDGAEFYTLVDRTTDRRYGPSTARTLTAPRAGPGMTSARLYDVGGRAVAVVTGEIRGRAVVAYVNLPAGEDPMAFEVSRVRIED